MSNRRVKCHTNGETYRSIREAAKQTGLKYGSIYYQVNRNPGRPIIMVVRNRRTRQNDIVEYYFSFVDVEEGR